MNDKERLELIINSLKEGKEKVKELIAVLKSYLDWLIAKNAVIIDSIETEKDLLNLVAEAIDKYTKTGLLEPIDGIILRKAMSVLDKSVLDRYLGSDWFVKLKEKVNKTLGK